MYYAVRVGRKPGIYKTWGECYKEVMGVKGAIFKKFINLEDAIKFISIQEISIKEKLKSLDAYAFTDGSFNTKTRVYGYGGFLMVKNGKDGFEKHIIFGSGNDKSLVTMRNVAGEIMGAKAAMEFAVEKDLKALTIIYDYAGVANWPTGKWKTNKDGTKSYKEYYDSIKDKIKISFLKVKGHSGIPGNEEADTLAKKACGIINFSE